MPLGYSSPGAAFGGGFSDYLMRQKQQEHQDMLDNLAMKREERLAQAELDSAAERRDEFARKKAKDLQDTHKQNVDEFMKTTKGMVKGDRPSPEMLDQEKQLGLHIFTQPPAPTSVQPMQPPAALMEAPPAGAPAEGVEQATPQGAVSPQPISYPGSPEERQAELTRQRQQAFVDSMDDSDPRKAELKSALGAEAAGLKVPTGFFSKSSGNDEAVMRQNPRTGTVERMVEGKFVPWTQDVPKGAHWMTEPAPKDNTAHEIAVDNARQRNIEHAAKRLYDELGKGELSKIVAAGDIQDAIAQNTEVADATLAPLVLKSTITAGGNSGFRMTKPEIDRVLTRSVADDLMLKLHAWTGSGPLQLTATQKTAMRLLSAAIYEKASKNYAKLNDAEDAINNAKDAHEINSIVTKTKRLFSEAAGETVKAAAPGPAPVIGEVNYDASGMLIPPGAK